MEGEDCSLSWIENEIFYISIQQDFISDVKVKQVFKDLKKKVKRNREYS